MSTAPSDTSMPTKASGSPERVPRVTELLTGSLALVVVGGIIMASHAPRPAPLVLPVILLILSAALLAISVAMIVSVGAHRWPLFLRVQSRAQMAFLVSGGLIEFAFARNHTRGATLVVITLMLVIYAVVVPMIIAFTVARYQRQ